jgi:SRSO17 transposase
MSSKTAKDDTARPVFVSQAVTGEDILETMKMVRTYVKPYQELLEYSEHRGHLERMLTGLGSGLERKSVEPIAVMHGLPRRALQRFVGENGWRHQPLIQQERQEVAAEIGLPTGSVIVDGSATPKKGTETVGVARQWCGRLGKVDNCVVGVYAAYVGQGELATLVGSELYLPQSWTEDAKRREKAHIPEGVDYQSQAAIAAGMIHELAGQLPFEWVLGDDEFGRARHFRDAVAELGKSYVLDVPENTIVHRITKRGRIGKAKRTVKDVARYQPVSQWKYFKVREAEKGPIEVRALLVDVATGRKRKQWVREKLLIVETLDGSQRWYCLARTSRPVEVGELVRQAGLRHRIEEVLEEAKGEVGLDHFEVRAWHGWYHHMTIVQLAHWFLVREKRRLGKKSTWPHRKSDSDGHCPSPHSASLAPASGRLHQLSPHPQPPSPLRTLPSPRIAAASSSPNAMTPLTPPAQ